ncbi:FitA-like ribbon-helix-helix domain-containing protein [Ruegeria arenilitoris]|uniref:FitA-like ribbon-helix-helix domain-containing protein n=1 Tax=Ruegeria arenilitoris TaxID=1173585 RepID=UPI0014809F74|nr:hypothetical protein [Ruegeria arenilitoris]
MANLNVKNLSVEVYGRLRIIAAERGVSIEEAARQLLDEVSRPSEKVGDVIVEYVQSLNAFLPEIKRSDEAPEPTDFS